MARFTETNEAAQLLQQILAMSTAAQPPQSTGVPEAAAYLYDDAEDDLQAPDKTSPAGPFLSPVAPPPVGAALPQRLLPAAPGRVIREVVTTQAGQVQLTLHTSGQLPLSSSGLDAETVAEFFQRVVRPLPNTDLSTT
jgi:hypothetical protein